MFATTYNYSKDNLGLLIHQAINNSEQIIISRDTTKSMVLMSLDEFNSWQETIYLHSNPNNAKHIYDSIEQANTGKVLEKELIEI